MRPRNTAALLLAAALLAILPSVGAAQPGVVIDATFPIDLADDTTHIAWDVSLWEGVTEDTCSAWLRGDGDTEPLADLYAVTLWLPDHDRASGRLPVAGLAAGTYLVDLAGNGCFCTVIAVPDAES
jgi:hypothetical protein